MGYYQDCAIPKGTPRVVDRIAKKRECEHCHEPLPDDGRVRRFCSMACRNRSIAEGNRIYAQRECPICRRRMEGKRLTCSAVCGYRFRKLRIRKPKECPICTREFWPLRGRSSKYCSKACYNAKLSERLAMVTVTCAHCARTFRRTRGAVKRVKHIFCNRLCRAKFSVGVNHPSWRGGHDANRGPHWIKLAASIRERDHHECRRCGRTETENKKRLDVDHIVPWRLFNGDIAAANDPRNLVSLCARCHRHKTAKLEAAYLKGDCIGMHQYERSVSLPPLFEHYKGVGR